MKTYTEERLLKTLANWGVSDDDIKALVAEMDEEQPEAEEKGGEPETPVEDTNEEEAEAKAPVGGEPDEEAETPTETEKPTESTDAYKQRFDALESRLSDIISSLEGLSAANKRNEEIIGSLGKKVKESPAPFGGIESSQEKDVKKSAEESAQNTLDGFGKMAGMR